VLLKRGDPPITYTYDLAATDEVTGDPDGDAVREVVLVRGDWDEELELSQIAEHEYRASRGGLAPGEVVYVTVVDVGTSTLTASDFRVYSSVEISEPEGDTQTSDASSTGEDAADRITTGVAVSACDCAAPGRPSTPGGTPWAAGLVLLAARRRRRR
jgi:MYXO-CTERM domain-containing protein